MLNINQLRIKRLFKNHQEIENQPPLALRNLLINGHIRLVIQICIRSLPVKVPIQMIIIVLRLKMITLEITSRVHNSQTLGLNNWLVNQVQRNKWVPRRIKIIHHLLGQEGILMRSKNFKEICRDAFKMFNQSSLELNRHNPPESGLTVTKNVIKQQLSQRELIFIKVLQ